MRAIIHFRIESFFASIEAKRHPELQGKPIVVVKSTKSGGIVVSISQEAIKLGVSEGMSIRHAQRVCPNGIFITADYPLYRSVSSMIMDVISNYSPVMETDSLDKAWIDVTGSRKLFGGPKKMAQEAIKIIEDIGYKAKAGIGVNKLVSQIASVQGRIRIVAPGSEEAFLAPISVENLPSVGEKTGRRLLDLGVKTIGQLASIPQNLLMRQFGKPGERLFRYSRGMDYSAVKTEWPPEVIANEHTFSDALSEPSEIEQWLGIISDKLAIELRNLGRLAQKIELKIKLDQIGDTMSHAPSPMTHSLKHPVDKSSEIFFALKRLLPKMMMPGMEVIGVSVNLSDLTIGEGMQLSLLGSSERKKSMDRLIETIHGRFGEKSIVYATSLSRSGRDCVIDRVKAV